MAQRAAILLAAVFLASAGLLATAPEALAHASLVSTDPAGGAVLARLPARVSATFDEPVGITRDSLRVFAPDGRRVDTGGTVHGSQPQQVTVALRSGQQRGTYAVSWRVVSDDSHPVQGAFTFSVGAPSSAPVSLANLSPPANNVVSVTFGVVRWLAYCCFALLIGTVAFLIWCWPAGAASRQPRRLALAAWAGLALSTLATLLLQGVYGTRLGVTQVLSRGALSSLAHSRFGAVAGARVPLVIVALFASTGILRGLPSAGARARAVAAVGWSLLTAALASTWAIADHAGIGIQVPLAVPADVVHLSAMAIWLGGLCVLATIVLRRPREHGASPGAALGQVPTLQALPAVLRFSRIALGCVIALVVTGTYQAWRGVGTWGALTGSSYGRLLLLKVTGMCALVCLGYLARRRIAHPLSDDVTLARLRWSVTTEAVVAAGVLAVTAVLVNTATGRESYHPPVTSTVAFSTGMPGGRGDITVAMTPGRPGVNQFRLIVTGRTGHPYAPKQIHAFLWLPARHFGPLTIPLVPAGPGRYWGGTVTLTVHGRWLLQVTMLSTAFSETTVSIPVAIH